MLSNTAITQYQNCILHSFLGPLEAMPKSSHHAQVPESTPGRREIHLPNSVFDDDDVSGLSSGHDLLHCDHLFALQSGLRVEHHGSGHVHYALLGKEH